MQKVLSLFLAMVLTGATAWAAQNDGIITVKTNKAGRPLVEKWAEVYKTVHPEVQIEVVSAKVKEADLTLVNAPVEGTNVTWVGRFALLPITAKKNPLREDIEKKTWSAKDFKRLFFADEELDEEELDGTKSKKEKLADKLTVYTGSHSTSWTPALAAYFGHTKDDVKGNKVAGDDYYLLNAIEEEPTAVTFSSLTFLYDLQSRSIRQNITLLPLNVKKEQGEALRSGNLDETIQLLETQHFDAIPVENVGFTYQAFDNDIDQFLAWVLNEGQQYNNEQGFLRLAEKDIKQQIKLLANR
ncbi:MAG: hypothetical protein IJV33_07520 [Bacteroidaceae bacterium]|nr:hypothetical protein [Bacteroidaceae bacterium]